jgi:biopolymer transport protein ExbD/biopolymer transport protein TolR
MAIGGRAGETFTEINVTPLTDVFLVLLVIMILIAPLVNQTVLKVDPPSQNASKTPPPPDKGPKINVEVLASGQVKINGQTLIKPDTTQVAAAIVQEQQKAGKTDLPLMLASDADALQRYNVAVMDAAAGAGIKQLKVLPLRNNH